MKRSVLIYLLCLFIAVIPFSILAQGNIKVGDYVEFGSYLGNRILWRVMELKDGPVLWSEFILCAKCFDAAESGKEGEGANDAQKWGSNLWSQSNIREWLNTSGKVNWTTRSPIKAAVMWGKNNYENELGFLTGFSPAERDVLVPTERNIIGHYFHRDVETTRDLVFLPTFEEIQNGGTWGMNDDDSRIKFGTAALMARNADIASNYKKKFGYQYFLMTPDDYGKSMVQAVGFGGSSSDQYSACHGCVGIAPVVQITCTESKSGDGSKKNPWKF